jgi:hypothetical protein
MPKRSQPSREHLECVQASACLGVGVDHDRRAGLDARGGDRGQDPRDVAGHPVALHGALEERGLDAGVIDALADLADEQLRDRFDPAVGEEVRQLEERVDPGRDDDVQIDAAVQLLQARDVPAEARHRRVDDRADPGLAHRAQLDDPVIEALLLIPVGRPEGVPVVLQRLGLQDEHVLVHQRGAELGGVYRAANRLNG